MNKFYRSIISRQAGIYWQIYFGFLIIVGSVVPQGDIKQISGSEKLPDFLKSLLITTQAYDLYKSPIFLFSLGTFFVVLTMSSMDIVLPKFKMVLKKTFTPSKKALLNYPILLEIKGADFSQAKRTISNKFKLVSESEGLLHFEKNKFSKSSAIVSHISLYLILAGVSWGLLTSFKSSAPLTPNESISIAQIVQRSDFKGKLVQDDKDNWSLKVNSFKIDYHPNGMIKQYYSDLSVLDNNDKELLRKTIYVNEPLVYNGVYFYQASWGISHLDVKIDGKQQNINLQPLKNNVGNVSNKVKLGNNEYVFYLDSKNNSYIFDLNAQPVVQLLKDSPVEVEKQKIELNDVVLFTGLQVKKDPGIPLVYIGFIILIVALIINFYAHSQIWLIENEGKYYLIGKAERGEALLIQDINKIADVIEIDKNLSNDGKMDTEKISSV
ncbi:MAG: cytochrome c biogenesis protein ResB [Candidatus Sericytochromatia bacterium]